ncbi:MAG: aromatic ring-hydroxylating dioxygenase subunit alpha [Pigmentiphaga sp.]|uniref:aromatic ring-hydroxylating oxygenase subunit alpha n=1 Tax=Pigmentiphaga sp. TaxID=1977564 RepID=UPI0029B134F8|nr:aromatic ring-hydroxylating dioxygenase subunit alpha [Pigmentiphaga sp.]MDX3906425.1 aromatic ring-hydroxylating dioxygenase subunit alpha [Pigmentiphaga sp.]
MPYIIDDPESQRFLLHREVHVSPAVLAEEMDKIFAKCWIYVGHTSELAQPGDFVTRKVAGRPVIFARDAQGEIGCFFNTCRHRGAVVATKREGNARRFFCVYHGWSYNTDGSLARIPGEDAYAESFDRNEYGLKRPPRFEHYRDFWFMCLDPEAPSLQTYLGRATEYIDLVVDQSPSGTMQVISGTQEYAVAANWKLMVENSVDDYHLPTTHSTWLNFMANSGVTIERPPREAGQVLPTKGYAISLGNGHFTTDNVNFRGRPVAHWIPLYGEAAREEIEAIRQELVERLGPERAERVANTNRNLVIFPNLVINDGSSVTIRTFFPDGPERMDVTAWALGPVEEDESARARRLDAFLTFYGPGGFATPDDVEALELVQQGMANWRSDEWSEMSRGMGKPESEQLNSDEHHLRTFWRHWNRMMQESA